MSRIPRNGDAFAQEKLHPADIHLRNIVRVKSGLRARCALFSCLALAVQTVASAAPAPTLDVATIDRERILRAANSALELEPPSIAKHRARLSQGGLNDFYSNADYLWPDPNKPDGLPYITRDGKSNPDNFSQHRLAMRQVRDAVAALAAAYKLTGDNRYVTKAVTLLRVFFLDSQTRMNPNLNYAQAVPGGPPGRSWGIIDGLHLVEIPPAITAMQSSQAFPPEVFNGLKQWFREMADWMTTTKNGKAEAAAKNNHSVAFFLQIAVFAKFVGDEKNCSENVAVSLRKYFSRIRWDPTEVFLSN